MGELSERDRIILLLEGAEADLEKSTALLEQGGFGRAMGYINSVISRLDRNIRELRILNANEAAEEEEKANMEALF